MTNTKTISAMLAATALAMTLAAPAYAGKADRARQEIAAAQAKVDTAKSMGTASELPVGTARADEALKTAQEELKAGHKSAAIRDAIHAQSLADAAIGETQKRKDAAAMAAQQASAAQTAAAQDQAAAAHDQAAQANARAASAEQSAANSAADANAARSAALLAAQKPTQVETTVTTQSAGVVRPATRAKVTTRKVTTKRATTVSPATTTTTVSTTTP